MALLALAFTACGDGGGSDPCTHNYQWVVTKFTAPAEETGTCSICGETATRPSNVMDFYGKWLNNTTGPYEPYNVTISASKFHLIDKDSDYITIDPFTWIPAAFPAHNNDMSAEYPTGYILSGTITTSSGYGYFPNPAFYVALSKSDKTKMLLTWGPSSTIPAHQIFEYQGAE